MVVSKVLFSSKDQGWGTPQYIYGTLNRKYGPFKLDAATRPENPLGTPIFYTEKDNGLLQQWYDPTFVNPPFGRGQKLYEWVKKAYVESCLGNMVVMLIPARTDTRWFHDFIYKRPKVDVIFLKGRLRFVDYEGKKHPHVAPFPSMIVVFRKY